MSTILRIFDMFLIKKKGLFLFFLLIGIQFFISSGTNYELVKITKSSVTLFEKTNLQLLSMLTEIALQNLSLL